MGGCFHEEWQKAGETGMVRHFFPWWMERALPGRGGGGVEPDRGRAGADGAGTGWTWNRSATGGRSGRDFRGLARQEYAEDEESCFLASGDSVFELDAIEAAADEDAGAGGAAAEWGAGDLAAAAEGQGVPGGGGSGGGWRARATTRRRRCWRWRRACSARSSPGTWADWSWRGW